MTSAGRATGNQRDWWVLAAVALPLAVLSVDFTGIIVALPTIGADLGVAPSNLGWVINAFALGFAGLLLVAGKASDLVGHRSVLLAGLIVFAAGSIVCGTSQTYGVLVAGRVVQGLGTACFMTASLALVSAAFDDTERPRAVGLWGAVGGAASAVGPLVAGVLTEWASWRWFFYVNLPLLAASVILALRTIPPPPGRPRAARPRFDLAGALLGTLGIVLVVVGLQQMADHDLTAVAVWGPLLAGALGLGTFLRVERRAADPLVAPALLHRHAYTRPTTAALVANVGFGVLQMLVTIELQGEAGWSALATGGAFLVYSVPFALVGGAMGRLARRWPVVDLLTTGLVTVAASFGLLTLIGPLPGLAVAGALAIGGIGQGLVYSASSTAAMGAVDEATAGEASGLLGVARNVGLAAGIAVASIAVARPDDVAVGVAVAAAALAVGTAATAVWTREAPRPGGP